MSALQSSDAMSFCVFLLFSGLTFTSGCTEGQCSFSCSPGESVLLPCRDVDSRVTEVQWWFSVFGSHVPQYSVFDSSEAQRYKDRIQIHRNHSLSISRLTLEDTGQYWCKINPEPVTKYVSLSVDGCSLSGNGESVEISRYSGESVLLSCLVKCGGQREPVSQLRWRLADDREINHGINPAELNQLSQFRIHMSADSGNLSLLISNLTEKDEGLYSCWIQDNQHKSFSLSVKGCTAAEAEAEPEVKYPGESVLLSCSCEDPKTKPEEFRWSRVDSSGTEVSIGGVHMFNKESPSNLSALISSLTEEDQGTYRCFINNRPATSTRLTIKGCVLSEYPEAQTSHVGKSVTLPCSCEDPKTKPKHSEWRRVDGNETLVSDTEDRNGRFQMIRDPPQSLSLRISNLSEADGGLYVCTVNGGQSRTITLTVTPTDKTDPSPNLWFVLFPLIALILLLLTAGAVYWRFTAKTGRRSSPEIQRPSAEDEVTYSSVTHIKGRKPAANQQQDDDVTYSSVTHVKGKTQAGKKEKEEQVVYSTMADVRNGSAQNDVTYASVVHIR